MLLSACRNTMWQAKFHPPQQAAALDQDAPFLKCHTVSGGVFVLSHWRVDQGKKQIEGTGLYYDKARMLTGKGRLRVPFGVIALLETNRPESVPKNTAQLITMGVVTGVSLLVSALCIAEPKACFGSCPTFYSSDGERLVLQAEGFSGSVARSLEEADVDSLYTARPLPRSGPGPDPFELRMSNEALETHLVRGVRLLAAPRPRGGRVFRAGGAFYPAAAIAAPSACTGHAGSCLAQVERADKLEYRAPTDPRDLAARQTVELSFQRRKGKTGLVIGARNSLVNTFLFYQILAYMGRSAGDWYMQLDQGHAGALGFLAQMKRRLGTIRVLVLTSRGWVHAGSFDEIGPIAREVQLVLLPEDLSGEQVRVRLELTRGYWKLDYLALATLGDAVVPTSVPLKSVTRRGKADPAALERLQDPKQYLVTYPGASYGLHFDLPRLGPELELFLESRGYYYEWIRKQWLAEEDPLKVLQLFFDPGGFLRQMAPRYKKMEHKVEQVFWQSRIGGP